LQAASFFAPENLCFAQMDSLSEVTFTNSSFNKIQTENKDCKIMTGKYKKLDLPLQRPVPAF